MSIVNVEVFTWMQRITAKNNGKNYYMIGRVKGIENTLLVTLVNGNGGAVMFCQKHDEVYPIHGTCAECRNRVVEAPAQTVATSCGKPEIER